MNTDFIKGVVVPMITPIDADEKIECAVCHANANVVKNEDLVDDFFEKAEMYNTNVEIISVDSEEGQMLLTAFGGIAAILRYKVQ